jgi:subtilisin family serine protease
MNNPLPSRAPARRRLAVTLAAVATAASAALVPNGASQALPGGSSRADARWADKIAPELLAQTNGLATTSADATQHRVEAIVNLAVPAGAGVDAIAAAQDAATPAIEASGAQVLRRYANVPAIVVTIDADALAATASLGTVAYVEDMPVAQTMDNESFPLTGTDTAHADGFRGQGTTIAIIDDGIDAEHEAFGNGVGFPNDKVIGGADFADFDDDPSIDCTAQSHGTATSGVAAANGGGITGTAPDASLVFVKIQSASICGDSGLDGDLVGAIDWVVSNRDTYGIDIISMSLGFGAFRGNCDAQEPALASAVQAASSAGILVFAASGNGASKSAMSAPACMTGAIAVGAVYDANIGPVQFTVCGDRSTAADRVTCYSNSSAGLDLLAPSNNAFTAQAGGGSTSTFGGTSSATPFAAGVAAAVLAAGASSDSVLGILVATGDPVTDPANRRTTPRVDTLAAVRAA